MEYWSAFSILLSPVRPKRAFSFDGLARGPLRVPRTPAANGNHFPSPYNSPSLFILSPLLPSYPLRPYSFP